MKFRQQFIHGAILVGLSAMTLGCANSWPSARGDGAENRARPMQVVNITSGLEDKNVPTEQALDQFYKGTSGDSFGSLAGQPQYANDQGVYNGRMLTKHVGDYVQNLTQDLISNMEYVTDKTPVGVTTFAMIDSDLQRTNLLGFQMAESFMHELHKYRIPVIDFKATDYIRVTEQGDFLLSRDFLELDNKAPIDYILTGTMTRHQGGVMVNARILGLKSKAVVASAQTLLPFYVVDALLPSEYQSQDGIRLIEGE